jgi:hypothetical protein
LATITISATATDPDPGNSISKVEFYQGGTLLPNSTDTTYPYSYTWSSVPAGNYVLTAKAYDNSGFVATSTAINVTVSNQPVNKAPTANAGADQTITLPAKANLTGTKSDDGLPNPPAAVTTTWSKVNGPGTVTFGNASALNTTATFSVAGTYTLRLTASDSALSASDDVVVTVNPSRAPIVSITAPLNNTGYTPPASITINATASETGGTISKVVFYQGSTIINTDTSSPYSYTWTGVAAGSYVLTARAYDTSNVFTTSAAINVSVTASDPCSTLCTSWTPKLEPIQANNIPITPAVCVSTTNMAGGTCGNMSGRTLKVNGTGMTCKNGQNWASLPSKRNGGYCIQVSTGGSSSAYYSTW